MKEKVNTDYSQHFPHHFPNQSHLPLTRSVWDIWLEKMIKKGPWNIMAREKLRELRAKGYITRILDYD